MLTPALLAIIEDAGVAALTLTEGLEKSEFLSSRITRAETLRQVKAMCDSATNLPAQAQARLPEIDWRGWQTVARQLGADRVAEQETLWFAVRSLAPATLMWLRVYRKESPEMFEFKLAAGVRPVLQTRLS